MSENGETDRSIHATIPAMDLDRNASYRALAARDRRFHGRIFAVVQAGRVLFAKQLIHQTGMTMVDIALASGFGSLRRFNETFRRLYRRPPSALRRQRRAVPAAVDPTSITLTLAYAPPYDWRAIIEFLAARAIPGVEVVDNGRYRRTIEIDRSHGTIEVAPVPGRDALSAAIRFPNVRALPAIVARIRRV